MELKHSGDRDYIRIYFDWDIINWCNYNCSYCFVFDRLQKELEYCSTYKLVLSRLKTVQTPFQICITGGEPIYHPNIIEIIKGIDECKSCDDILLFTNLNQDINYYKKLDDIHSSKLKLLASFHPEFYDSSFLNKCIDLNKLDNINFIVHLTLSDQKIHWEKTISLYNELKNNNIKLKPMLLQNTNNYSINYTKEFYSAFSYILDDSEFYDVVEHNTNETKQIKSFDILLNKENTFKGYSCRTTSFRISMNGDIENTCSGRKIPFLLNNKNLIVNEICTHDRCISDRMLEFYKEKSI